MPTLLPRRCPITVGVLLATLPGCGLPLLPDWFADDDAGWTDSQTARGRVTSADEYQVFELGPAVAGDGWQLARADGGRQGLNVALFDDQWNLLQRTTLDAGEELQHTLRRSSPGLKLAVSGNGSFEIRARQRSAAGPRVPAPQVVYLNFEGGHDVVIGNEDAFSFPALDAADVWPEYAGATDELRAAILATLRERYDGFNVRFITHPSERPAAGAYSTIHFGGAHAYLLGLADQVDRYNADPGDSAIVYVESFGQYVPIGLTVADMGRFIGNVAAHELGHLLGLVHTRDPQSLMDVSGGVYDLAGDRRLGHDPLEPAVFPAGLEHAPLLLAETVGLGPGLDVAGVMKRQSAAAAQRAASGPGLRGEPPLSAAWADLFLAPPLHACAHAHP